MSSSSTQNVTYLQFFAIAAAADATVVLIRELNILMTVGLFDFVELFVALDKLRICRSMATFEEFRFLLVLYYDAEEASI